MRCQFEMRSVQPGKSTAASKPRSSSHPRLLCYTHHQPLHSFIRTPVAEGPCHVNLPAHLTSKTCPSTSTPLHNPSRSRFIAREPGLALPLLASWHRHPQTTCCHSRATGHPSTPSPNSLPSPSRSLSHGLAILPYLVHLPGLSTLTPAGQDSLQRH